MQDPSPLYSQQGQRVKKRYDAPKWAALLAVGLTSALVFLMLGAVQLIIAVVR